MEKAKPLPQSQKNDSNRRKCSGQRTEKSGKNAAKTRHTSCGKAENMLYYLA